MHIVFYDFHLIFQYPYIFIAYEQIQTDANF